jgi:hypothetical protein
MVDFDPRARFAAAPVARLATVGPDGGPHLVPVVFAVRDDVVYTAIDAKPKSTQRLRRLANIAGNPLVSLLVDTTPKTGRSSGGSGSTASPRYITTATRRTPGVTCCARNTLSTNRSR